MDTKTVKARNINNDMLYMGETPEAKELFDADVKRIYAMETGGTVFYRLYKIRDHESFSVSFKRALKNRPGRFAILLAPEGYSFDDFIPEWRGEPGFDGSLPEYTLRLVNKTDETARAISTHLNFDARQERTLASIAKSALSLEFLVSTIVAESKDSALVKKVQDPLNEYYADVAETHAITQRQCMRYRFAEAIHNAEGHGVHDAEGHIIVLADGLLDKLFIVNADDTVDRIKRTDESNRKHAKRCSDVLDTLNKLEIKKRRTIDDLTSHPRLARLLADKAPTPAPTPDPEPSTTPTPESEEPVQQGE